MKCAVFSCKHDSRKHNKKINYISFHRFPKNREMAQEWANAINRPNWEPNIRSCVCSVHFNLSSISETKKGLRKLAQGAMPELHVQDEAYDVEKVALSTSKSVVVVDTKEHTPVSKDIPRNIRLEDQTNGSTKKNVLSAIKAEECTIEPNDNPSKCSLKRQIINLREIAKRRRLRCNALYAQKRRLKQKVESLTQILEELRQKDVIT